MNRRHFLALLGVGAGGLGSGFAWRSLTDSEDTVPKPTLPTVAASRGQQRIIWSVETNSLTTALTFDDGPDPAFTPRILDILDKYSVKATFFALGHNAAQHPQLLREVVEAGHEIGSHGWRHQNLADASPDETRREIVTGTHLIEDHAQVAVRAFRPPYGRFNDIAIRILAGTPQDMYVWSVTRGDLSSQDPSRVAAHVVRETRRGDIVDLHDGIGRGTFQRETDFAQRLIQRRTVEVEALPEILERTTEMGIRFTTVSGLMEQALPSRVSA